MSYQRIYIYFIFSSNAVVATLSGCSSRVQTQILTEDSPLSQSNFLSLVTSRSGSRNELVPRRDSSGRINECRNGCPGAIVNFLDSRYNPRFKFTVLTTNHYAAYDRPEGIVTENKFSSQDETL